VHLETNDFAGDVYTKYVHNEKLHVLGADRLPEVCRCSPVVQTQEWRATHWHWPCM